MKTWHADLGWKTSINAIKTNLVLLSLTAVRNMVERRREPTFHTSRCLVGWVRALDFCLITTIHTGRCDAVLGISKEEVSTISGSHRRRSRTGEVGVKKLFKLDSLIAKSHALFSLYPSNHKVKPKKLLLSTIHCCISRSRG